MPSASLFSLELPLALQARSARAIITLVVYVAIPHRTSRKQNTNTPNPLVLQWLQLQCW